MSGPRRGRITPLVLAECLESKGRFERYGTWGITKVILKMVVLFLKDQKGRGYLKEVTGGLSKDLLKVMGYGVYVGRKG